MTTTRTETALIRELGRVDYEPTFAAMRAFTDARTTDTRDELWIVEHPPVFTLGLAAYPTIHDGEQGFICTRGGA